MWISRDRNGEEIKEKKKWTQKKKYGLKKL